MSSIAEDIKKGEFNRIYLLYGEEAYLRQSGLKRLLNALGVSAGDMNFTKFTEKKTEDKDVTSICDTLPFFAERRVVLLDGLDLFKTKHEQLTEYIKNVPDYLVLIIHDETTDKRSALYKAIAKSGTVQEFKKAGDKEIEDHILRTLAISKKRIRKSAYAQFITSAGTDLNYINCELEKLIAYTGDRAEITPEDIAAVCSPVIENRVFDLVSAVAAGDRQTALLKYDDLIVLKEPPMKILYLLARQFDQLLHIKELQEDGSGAALIAEKLKMNPYVVKKLLPVARRYPTEKLRAAVEDMVRAEEDVKTGRLDERISVELMLMKYS